MSKLQFSTITWNATKTVGQSVIGNFHVGEVFIANELGSLTTKLFGVIDHTGNLLAHSLPNLETGAQIAEQAFHSILQRAVILVEDTQPVAQTIIDVAPVDVNPVVEPAPVDTPT